MQSQWLEFSYFSLFFQQLDRDEILLQLSTVRVLFSGSPSEERTAVCKAIITTADFLYSNLVSPVQLALRCIIVSCNKAGGGGGGAVIRSLAAWPIFPLFSGVSSKQP